MNTGSGVWHVADVVFGFVRGDKLLRGDTGGEISVPYTLYTGDRAVFHRRLTPPKEPGVYTSVWGLRKTNKSEFFCTFDITIQVVK